MQNPKGKYKNLRTQKQTDIVNEYMKLKHDQVAKAAFCIAERRGFVPGHELEDWLAAEEEIKNMSVKKEDQLKKQEEMWKLFDGVVGEDAGPMDLGEVEEVVKEQLIKGLSGLNPEYLTDEEEE